MPELSPAAQVMIAVTHVYQEHGGDPPARAVAAAVLRAIELELAYMNDYGEYLINADKLSAIADELEAQ